MERRKSHVQEQEESYLVSFRNYSPAQHTLEVMAVTINE